MKVFILHILVFYATCLSAQNNSISVSIGSSGTSRILYFPNNNFSSSEIRELKKLEVVKPSFQADFGYSMEKNQAIFIRFGLGFRHTRFGSKKYRIPIGIPNTTPQTNRTKQVVLQNQGFVYFESSFNQYKFLKSSSIFLKVMLIRNHRNYKIYVPDYNENGNKTTTGIRSSGSFTSARFDINLSLGLNYNLLQNNNYSILFQPYLSLFALPYETIGTDYSYLHFNKNVVGFISEIGLLMQYKFKIRNKKVFPRIKE